MDRNCTAELNPVVLRTVLDDIDDIVLIADSSGIIQYVNRAFEKVTGYSFEEVRGKTPSILRSHYHHADYYSRMWQVISAGQPYHGEVINRKKNGTFYFEEKVITPMIDSDGKITHFVSTGRDVTWRRKAERLLRMRFEISELFSGNWPLPLDGIQILLQAIGRHLGAALVEYWARNVHEYERKHQWSVDSDSDEKPIKIKVRSGFAAVVEHRRRSTFFTNLQNNPLFSQVLPDHGCFDAALAAPVMSSEGHIYGMIVVYKAAPESQDTETLNALTDTGLQIGEYFRRREAEARLRNMAYFDMLTGLPNRNFFYDHLQRALHRAKREQTSCAVLFIDLDRFKLINDTSGHHVGDEVIMEVAARLRRVLRPADTVARLAGDEFLILVENFESMSDVQVVCQRILKEFKTPFVIDGREIHLQVSIGVAGYPADGSNPADLIRHADQAMYRAKQVEGSAFTFFNDELDRELIDFLEIQALLLNEIQNGFRNMAVHYQPLVDPISHKLLALEALLRWNHPQRGEISPALFVPHAEKAGLIQKLTEFVLDRVRTDLLVMRESVPEIAINISGKLLYSPDFLDFMRSFVDSNSIDAKRLVLEITETAAVQFFEESRRKLQFLKEMGFRIALDDFGTGHSSLNYLLQLPVDQD
jgi:diguanylate cyclase (GGDEF)-like protein/PAS domain S-box-containing protein